MRHPLPYARSTQLLLEDVSQQLTLSAPRPVLDSATLQALSEVQRKYAVQQWAESACYTGTTCIQRRLCARQIERCQCGQEH